MGHRGQTSNAIRDPLKPGDGVPAALKQ